MKNFGLASGLILLTFLSSCIDNDMPDTAAQKALDIQKIEKYLTDNNITGFVKDPSGFFYVIDPDHPGNGNVTTSSDHVNMTYVAKLLNGTTAFQQTSIPVFHTVGNIGLVGLRAALQKFSEGTIATVYIPSGLAYGSSSSTNIPKNSILIFEVEVFNVAHNTAEILEVQKGTIDQYILDNEIENVQTHESGLRYVIDDEGSGDFPTENSSISVKYKGTLLSNGEKFDEATSSVTFELKKLIEGWRIGFPLLKEGSRATFYIPSGLGYGPTGYNTIPPHAILKFEVELIEVL